MTILLTAKMHILYEIWNRELNHLQKGALKGKDKKSKQLLADLNQIKQDVKEALMKTYLFRCSIKHSLAFFQWRARFNDLSDVSSNCILI